MKQFLKIFIMFIILASLIFVNVNAAENSSVFNEVEFNRYNLKNMTTSTFGNMNNSVELGISKIMKSGNYYNWNKTTTENGKTIWKIANINEEGARDYSNLYYCLNATRGFGLVDGEMAEGATDTYIDSFDFTDSRNENKIIRFSGSKIDENYNKIIYILDNLYIPTGNLEYQSSEEYLKLMRNAKIDVLANKNLNLTEDDIDVVQQMAIWYFTNSDNAEYSYSDLPSLYLNGNQLSSLYIGTDEYGSQITGQIRQENANKLYKFFIDSAVDTYLRETPVVDLIITNVITEENENYFILGPYRLEGENTQLISAIVPTISAPYILLDDNKVEITNNDFYEVINKNFYLKFNKDVILSDNVSINLNYKYNSRDLEFLTDSTDELNTQPVIKIEETINEEDINVVTEVKKQFDLALRKFVTKVNEVEFSREPIVDTSTIITKGTATYKHTKQPIVVKKGDIVTYTIRVYNEGGIEGYVDRITDYLPKNLLPIIEGVEGIDKEKYKNEIDFNLNYIWIYNKDDNSITTMVTSKDNSELYGTLTGLEEIIDTKLNAYTIENTRLDYIDVQVKCLVTEKAVNGQYLTNIAEISESQDINGLSGDGSDSILNNVNKLDLVNYKNSEALASTENSYVIGQEDDDDFEKLIVKEFDLSLRKFINKVNNIKYSREPKVDTTKLGSVLSNGKIITTAIYNHSKDPVIVETEDIITYTIRIYNEGLIDGYANEIVDNIPEGLEFIVDSTLNKTYNWKMLDENGAETLDVTKAKCIITDYLSEENEENIIKSYEEVDGNKVLSYKDIEVQFKVIAKVNKYTENIIKNVAQISSDTDNDIDSIPTRTEKYDYINGNNEDDIDFEPIKLQYFDLALRKFITKINSLDYNNRYPEISYTDNGDIVYNHSKEPEIVTTGDIITYTIRVYNEGEKSGTASNIVDDLPDGLEFIVDNEINKSYGWKLIDKDGKETSKQEDAVKVSTDILKNEKIDGIIKTESGSTILSYKDIKIVFKVSLLGKLDNIIINTAEISADTDEDIDSIPDNNIYSEDDLDKEYIKVMYFDMALKKWVTQVKVTYNGNTIITKTCFTEDSDEIAKVDLVAKQMSKTSVKFAYNIKVVNEGQVAGYVTEIKDYVPEGLIFNKEDNPDWEELENGEVVTRKLENTLLKPKESAIVEIVLTWQNSNNNLGLKTNFAEISKDSGEDIDSTPDNYNKYEDDIDSAQVILSIKTAGTPTYIGLTLITILILISGIILIKKYVIE